MLKFDPFKYDTDLAPFRVASVSETCFTHTFYPAQATIKNMETIDGASVFYDKKDAFYWHKYVTEGADPCLFYAWNNNMYMCSANWQAHPDRIAKWLRLNNVAFVRAEVPIQSPDLNLEQQKTIVAYWWRLNPKKVVPAPWTWQLYRVKNPLSRVMSVPHKFIYGDEQLRSDDAIFENLDKSGVQNVPLDSYVPSQLEWHGSFDSNDLLISSNFHKNWHLLVDGKWLKDGVSQGPFGMIHLRGLKGEHTYRLQYRDRSFLYSMVCMILGLFLLWRYCCAFRRLEA